MKKLLYIITSAIMTTAAFTVSSCGDMLEQDSDHFIYADNNHLNNATDTMYSVIGIMNKLQVLSDRTVLLGELRGDLVDVNNYTSADLRGISNFDIADDNMYNSPRDYYAVINNCNYFIANADTTLKNNRNEYVFRREYAAVKAFRAWTYLQLVLNYGKVPLVTEPMLTKDDAEKDYPKAGIEDVCKYFINDIAPYADVDYPQYGAIRGNDSRLFYFPINLLMGDLNLWVGNYREAALCYYKYICKRNGQNSSYPISTTGATWNDDKFTFKNSGYAYVMFNSETYTQSSEQITMIPGDSIPSEGNYSELQDIFSSTANNQYHNKIDASWQLKNLSASQIYCHLDAAKEIKYAPSDLKGLERGDLRLYNVYQDISWMHSGSNVSDDSWENNKYSLRNVHINRRTIVYLRMAEALNRAGFPRFAFAILKSGVNNEVIENDIMPYYPEDTGYLSQFDFPNTQYVLRTKSNLSSENTIGIHSHGSGWSEYNEYYVFPDNGNLSGNERTNYQIEAVEDLVINENALETCFEGFRYYDLMRVALRRGDASYLANKIYARRGADKVNEMKSIIKCDLNNTNNWYMKWNGKIGMDIK